VDVATESVACVEQGAGGLDASAADFSEIDAGTTDAANADVSASDAGAIALGTFYAGRLTQSHRALTVVPQGREEVQALAASDSLLVFLSSGGARVHLDTGSVEVLPTQINSQFGVTQDENWLLWLVNQKTNVTGTRSLVASPFPAGGTRYVLLGDVFRHHFVDGPRAAGADVVTIAGASDGTNHLMVAGRIAPALLCGRILVRGQEQRLTGSMPAVVAATPWWPTRKGRRCCRFSRPGRRAFSPPA